MSGKVDEIEIFGSGDLYVVSGNSSVIKIRGKDIEFRFFPHYIAEALKKQDVSGVVGVEKPKKLITKNRGIVMQGEKACVLPDTQWEILTRIFYSIRKAVTISELCDPKQGVPIWDYKRAPDSPSLDHLAKGINDKLASAGILLRVSHRNGVFSFESRYRRRD